GGGGCGLEAKSVIDLIQTSTAQNLVRAFFLKEKFKNTDHAQNASKNEHSELRFERVHVVGAGIMGGDIAAWCALKGLRVSLQDTKIDAIAKAFQRAQGVFQAVLKENYLVKAALDRMVADPQGNGISKADVLIEAVIENLELKQNIFKNLEKQAKPDAILASNTSTIPLEEIAEALQDPSRLVGLHFFNPVSKMELLEVIHGQKTKSDILNQALAFATKIDKLPLKVKSSPGFLVNRILMPYLLESALLVDEGHDKKLIDQAALNFGMPMGPITLADTVGIDVCVFAAKSLFKYYGGTLPKALEKLFEAGNFGKKTGQGFYNYASKSSAKVQENAATALDPTLAERMILRLINEAAACLREGLVADADAVDAGMIYGTGFAPFLGGPLHYAQSQGLSAIKDRLLKLEASFGPRFKPDLWFDQH
ncbi:MAG: 3-hydroxyacyl-CoA dehydrogenase NAD-binding domain-containing protein, partial [Gammaproteobacteria bacterium]